MLVIFDTGSVGARFFEEGIVLKGNKEEDVVDPAGGVGLTV